MKYSARFYAACLVSALIWGAPDAALAQRSQKKAKPLTERESREAMESFTEGMKYHMLENWDRALPYFEKTLQINPNNAAALFKIAEIKARQENWAQATEFAEKALNLDEGNTYYYALVAQLYEKQNRFADANKIYQRLLKKKPEAHEYYFNIAANYLYQNKIDDAIKTYDTIEKLYGVNEEITRQKQQIYLRQNKLNEAIKEGRNLIAHFPDDPTHVLTLAELLIANKKTDEASELMKGLLAKHPDNAHSRLILAEIYHNQGKEKQAKEQLEVAFGSADLDIDSKIKILVTFLNQLDKPGNKETALHLASLTVKTHPDEPKSHAMYGDLLSYAGQRAEAREHYIASTRLDNSKFMVWQQIVAIDMELQQYDSLVEHSEMAIELFPNQAEFWLYNGVGHFLTKNHKKAANALEQGKKLAFNNKQMLLQFYSQLGDTYHELKDFKKSEAAYEEALRLEPNYAPVLNNYSYYLSLRKDKLDKARKMGEKLVKENPDNSTYLDTYGWVLYISKDYSEAKKYLERAVKNTKSGIIVEHYGDVLYRLGEVEKALEQWRKAKEMGGDVTELIDKKIATRTIHE